MIDNIFYVVLWDDWKFLCVSLDKYLMDELIYKSMFSDMLSEKEIKITSETQMDSVFILLDSDYEFLGLFCTEKEASDKKDLINRPKSTVINIEVKKWID